ncbi:MAG: hypothetical protein AB7U20_06580 [Planctomycetaceae bacterium]
MGIICLCLAVPGWAVAQSDVPSIREFVAAKDLWPQRVGRPLTLEGRYSALSGTELRFAGCDLRFLLPKSFVKPRQNVKNVEVSGQLEKQNGELVFVIRSLKTRPSDEEMLDRRRVTIDTSRPESLLELGQWARDRGRFYEDEPLLQAGNRILESGLTRAFDALDSQDADGMRALAARAESLGLDGRLRRQYLHEANRADLERELKQPKPNYQALLRNLSQELPGCREPLPPGHESLRKDYAKDPRLAYRVADHPTRQLLDRIFFGEMTIADITRNAAADGSNGYAIAAQIEKRLPERGDLAKMYRDRELKHLSGRVTELNRDQLLDLSGRHDARGEPDRAQEIKRRWLDSRVRKAAGDGPLALVELGEDYLNLLQDERAAARMFQLAYEANPQLTTASAWLAEHGYELRDGRWSLPGEAARTEQDDLVEAIHEGRVLEGMTGAQVRAALGGAPSSVARIASAGLIAEVWLYDELGISVQLTRRSRQKELTVRRVTNAP